MTIATSSDTPTQPDIINAFPMVKPLNTPIYTPRKISDNAPRIRPFPNPTLISLTTRDIFSLPVRFSSMSTRIVTARDCVPTLPAMSRMRD